jgi:hypothetical protein
MKTKALLLTMFLVILAFACKKDDDAFPPGHVWKAGDYPSLTAPAEMDNVGIGEPVFVKSAKHAGTFKPTIKAVKGNNWVVKITRRESALCETWYQWTFPSEYWSNEIPVKKYEFKWPSFPWDCYWHNNSSLNLGGQHLWPKTEVKTLTLMMNGEWYPSITLPSFGKRWSGDDYDVSLKFNLGAQPDLYIGKVRTWVVYPGDEYDQYELEGTYTIKTIHKTGASITNSSTFSTTLGLGASVPIKGITVDINKSWTNTYGESITVSEESSIEKTKTFTVPAGERWRFITVYGVERYSFTTKEGTSWAEESGYFELQSLGNFDNIVRTFLMVVKYRDGSVKAYSSDLIDVSTMDNVRDRID